MVNTRVKTGVEGLDTVLDGGLIKGRNYLVRGDPGVGKTILGMEYLDHANEEASLFINLGQSNDDLLEDAEKLGFNIEDSEVLDLSTSSEFFEGDKSHNIFKNITKEVTEAVEKVDPERVFVDPISQFRYLTEDERTFRKKTISFLRFLKSKGATVVFTSETSSGVTDEDLRYISDGIISLRYREKRTLTVTKLRGSAFQGGDHAVKIDSDGMHVYPEMLPREHGMEFTEETVSSGIGELDSLMGGGIERGTTSIITGPSGAGKTTVGTQFMAEAARRDEKSVIYMFEEAKKTLIHRSREIGMPIDSMLGDGNLVIEEVEPLAVSAEEFAHDVLKEVEQGGAQLVMIDGIAGYRMSLLGSEGDELTRKLHALCRCLKNLGVTVVLISETTSIVGKFTATEDNLSYLADNIFFIRYMEETGEIRRYAGVLKKRASDFERTVREMRITPEGVEIGEPLTNLKGALGAISELKKK
jgi:circadian clock protein KaiC